MNTIVDDVERTRIARRLRLERDSRNWSLADLAERSGVSKAMISKIERAEVSPTAVILVRLAAAFDLTLAGLMLRAEGQGERLIRAADQPVWRDPETGYLRKQVFSRPDHPLEIIRVELPAGQRVVLPASSYAHIRQVVWVQSRQPRPDRSRRAARARGRRLPRLRPALRGDLCQRNRRAVRLCRRRSPGADVMPDIEIARPCTTRLQIREALSEILIEAVASGGSVSFMHPLAPEAADAFWQRFAGSAAARRADRSRRLRRRQTDRHRHAAARPSAPNQPHRAEIAKMMTRVSHRGRGVATALMGAAERMAVERGRTLLVLDTAVEDGASGLYERLGFQLAGDDSGLRAEAAWRADRHDDLLEADRADSCPA